MWPGWPHQQPATIEIQLPLTADQPAQQPTHSYSASSRLEAEVRRLAAEVDALEQTVAAMQQQQQPARQPRRRWWYRRETVEVWGDDNQA
jgi:hypothetical protein